MLHKNTFIESNLMYCI